MIDKILLDLFYFLDDRNGGDREEIDKGEQIIETGENSFRS
jgi:hypothetical protein